MRMFIIMLSILFAIFITLYISQTTGYYNYEQYKKTELTKEKIAEFERDLKEGKEIKIDNYINKTEVNYNNNASLMGLKISNTIKKYMKKGIDGTLTMLSMLFG